MDSALIFSPDFILSFEEKFRNQHIELELRIPDGQKVYLDRSIHRIIDDVDNVHHMWDYDMLGKIWTMQKEGLTCTSCTPAEIDKAQREYDDMMGRYNHYDDDGDSNHHPQPAK
jgi:hypothetical protein